MRDEQTRQLNINTHAVTGHSPRITNHLSLQRPARSLRKQSELFHRLGKCRRSLRLGAIGGGMLRVGMDLDDQRIGTPRQPLHRPSGQTYLR